MIELHGWLTIRSTFQDEDLLPDSQLSFIQAEIDRILQANTCGLTLQYANGIPFLSTLFCSNHHTAEVDELIHIYQAISTVASGSYGILHLWDDEAPLHSNEFQIYVFRRGSCVYRTDTDFSPCIPTIEDPYC